MLCTFNTPEGRYRFLRLPYGILSAPEVYHKRIHMIFEHIPGVETMMDDIIVWGSTKEEHDSRLRQVMELIKKVNLKLNKDKCEFGVKTLTFMGDVVSEEGVKPDPRKISAIVNMERPNNTDDVRRFLGMITYLGKFISQLSEQTAPLRWLLDKNNEWMWSHEQEESWQNLKQTITEQPVLRFFDPTKRIRISADASQFGLGSVLLQEHEDRWQPVIYASRALTSAETRYAQIEKELLAITYACERFHQFVYGQAFTVETDHKPLVAIMTKSLHDCPMRIQRMLIRLQKYDVHLLYCPGKYMYIADTLSRAVDKSEGAESLMDKEIDAYVNLIVASLPVSLARQEQIRNETETDVTMKALQDIILKGWPAEKNACPLSIHDYWMYRSDLTVVNGIIYKGNRIVIPARLRKTMLCKIHEGHLGEEKCKRRAREVMYWPRMNQDIAQTTATCELCLMYRPKQQVEPLSPHAVPERPYQKVGADLFDCIGKMHIVVTDYYSNYPEVQTLPTTTSKAVISCMKSIFARHGVPMEVFTDNGPQFSSAEFKQFAEEWEFVHTTSSPHYPRSNGLVESSVKTVKSLMKKAQEGKEDFYKSLLIYRSTPLQNGLSPAQMLMGRRIRANLPISDELLNTHNSALVRLSKERQQEKQKLYHDRRAKSLSDLRSGDQVRLRDHEKGIWMQKGIVQAQVAPRSYTVRTDRGTEVRRNRVDLRSPPNHNDGNMTEEYPSSDMYDGLDNGEKTMIEERSNMGDETQTVYERPKREIRRPERLIETC